MTWHSSDALWLLGLVPMVIAALIIGLARTACRDATLWRPRHHGHDDLGAARRASEPRARCCWCSASPWRLSLWRARSTAAAHDCSASAASMWSWRSTSRRACWHEMCAPAASTAQKQKLTKLVSELAGDRIGIVAFAGETMEFPMTVDYAAAALFFRELGPYDMPVGGTAIGRALGRSQATHPALECAGGRGGGPAEQAIQGGDLDHRRRGPRGRSRRGRRAARCRRRSNLRRRRGFTLGRADPNVRGRWHLDRIPTPGWRKRS